MFTCCDNTISVTFKLQNIDWGEKSCVGNKQENTAAMSNSVAVFVKTHDSTTEPSNLLPAAYRSPVGFSY